MTQIKNTLGKIILSPQVVKTARHNALHAILFEAVNVIIVHPSSCDGKTLSHGIKMLGQFVAAKEANIRYMGLNAMHRLVKAQGLSPNIKSLQSVILTSLKDADSSVRKKALSLLFVMCDSDTALQVLVWF